MITIALDKIRTHDIMVQLREMREKKRENTFGRNKKYEVRRKYF